MRPTLKAGMLAYMDTMRSGLVPCRVLSVSAERHVSVVVTADRPCYPRGVRVIAQSATWIVPRAAIRRRKHGTYVLPYDVLPDVRKDG